jgi:hypothetical protein
VSSSLKDLQCIAVHEVDVSSVIQSKYHSPAEWAGCRVTDSHPLSNEPCRQTFAAHGRPRLSYREHHWIAPMDSLQRSLVYGFGRLTTAPLRWTTPTRPSHRTSDSPRKERNRQQRLQIVNPEEERDKGRETEKGPLGALRHLSKHSFSLQTFNINYLSKRTRKHPRNELSSRLLSPK